MGIVYRMDLESNENCYFVGSTKKTKSKQSRNVRVWRKVYLRRPNIDNFKGLKLKYFI